MVVENGPTPLDNLPAALNAFIGRQSEIAQLRQALTAHRMVTLTGQGGCGKTRLAIQVASELRRSYPDGTWLVEFGSLSDGGLSPQALAAVLGVREEIGRPLMASLLSYLKSRTALLLLDNCEHLLSDLAHLCDEILSSCPHVRLLATSREPLGVPGEVTWPVSPLSLPEAQPWRSPEQVREALNVYRQSEAVQLFTARAVEAAPAFELDDQNGPWVAEICRRLDGIPLAIELAAARMRTFSTRQIAERLDERFHLLTSRLRTGPARHQTLEAAMDWSFHLLPEVEQTVFRRLAVFPASWSLGAAEEVCSSGTLTAEDVANTLSNLVDKSLVVVDHCPTSRRYRLLETVRQYARGKLAAAGEAAAAQDRHLDHFLSWAEMAERNLTGRQQAGWLERFELEHDNLRAALEWSLSGSRRPDNALQLAAACGRFWRLHNHFSEGRERISAALGREAGGGPVLARSKALLWAANLAYMQSDYPAVRSQAQEGLRLSRALGDEALPEAAKALGMLGEMDTEVGEYDQALVLFEEALDIYQELGDQRGTADMLMQLGWAAMRMGDYGQAEPLLHECLRILKGLDEAYMISLVLAGLGEMAVRQGKLAAARQLLEESLSLRRALGDHWGVAGSLGSLGWAALLERNFERVHEYIGESLSIRLAIGDHGGTAWCLEKLAGEAALRAQDLPFPHRRRALQRAVTVFAAAAALRSSIQSMIDPVDQPEHERSLASLRAGLGEEAYARAWDEGSLLASERAAELALSPLMQVSDAASLSAAQAAKIKFGGLSGRERQTAYLIAQGRTNREIAEQMTVGVKTVETYVMRILNKLGASSRVQIATWALEAGLREEDAGKT